MGQTARGAHQTRRAAKRDFAETHGGQEADGPGEGREREGRRVHGAQAGCGGTGQLPRYARRPIEQRERVGDELPHPGEELGGTLGAGASIPVIADGVDQRSRKDLCEGYVWQVVVRKSRRKEDARGPRSGRRANLSLYHIVLKVFSCKAGLYFLHQVIWIMHQI